MPGNASRINGQKGGRPKGSENFDTKQRREMKNRWLERVHNDADAIFDAQLTLALGCYTEKQTPEGIQKVYKRPPDAKSLQWIMEQVWGKADNLSHTEGANEPRAEYVLSEEEERSLNRAIAFAMPANRREIARLEKNSFKEKD